MLPLIIASLAATASAFIPFVPAVPVERRYAYEGGGWGLMTSGNCPGGTTQMSDVNLYICCPNGMTQEDGTGPGARVCCVDGGSCLTALQATPFCADSTWVLWNATSQDPGHTYFCCQQNQIGTQNMDCVGAATNVAATLSADKLGQPTPTGLGAATFSGATASGSASMTTGSATYSATTTGTSTASTSHGGFGGLISAVASHVTSDTTALKPLSLETFGRRVFGFGSGVAGIAGVAAVVFALRV